MGSIFGGSKSGGFQAKNAPTAQQLNTSYNQTQDSISQQNAFVQALQAQNGLANQSNVFGQQQQLANQYQGVINGTGPNPALDQLNQQTGNNVAQQNALMAGQRGASQNVGLIARQAGQQGANIQQQAVGQEATLQAQQQIAAMQGLQAQQQAMAGTAQNQIGNVQTGLNAYGQQTAQQQSTLQGANQSANSINANVAAAKAAAGNNLIGNLAHVAVPVAATIFGGPAAGAAASAVLGSGGSAGSPDTVLGPSMDSGQISSEQFGSGPKAANGGMLTYNKQLITPKGPRSKAAQHIMMASGGQVPLLLSPGERKLNPHDVAEVAKGANPMTKGKEVPGKAKVGGAKNSYANDTHKDAAEPGSIIIPRSITQGKDASKKAAAFVEAILKSKSAPRGK